MNSHISDPLSGHLKHPALITYWINPYFSLIACALCVNVDARVETSFNSSLDLSVLNKIDFHEGGIG